jgi:hypothetical protein
METIFYGVVGLVILLVTAFLFTYLEHLVNERKHKLE